MATSKLSLFNGALRICQERKLASLTEAREPRRLLDAAWGDGRTEGAVKLCLEMGQWTFATRSVLIDYSPSVEPDWGYRYAFNQPDDLVRVAAIAQDEYFQVPLLRYSDERRYWYADCPSFHVKYVSNDTTYGGDTSLWPEWFAQMVEAALAVEIAGNLTQSENKIAMADKAWARATKMAKANDAMAKPTAMLPQGSWVSARGGPSNRSRWDGTWR